MKSTSEFSAAHVLKPYPTYESTGVEWLGDVPAHWAVERLKGFVENVADQSADSRGWHIIVALEHVESWTGRVARPGSETSVDGQLKRFRSGDVLFGKLRPYLAKVARLASDGLCVGEFFVLRRRHENVNGAYIEHLLRSKPIVDGVNSSTFGAKMPRANWQFVGGMPVARPPVAEQVAIARFLNHAGRRIQRYIRAKERLIALLEEQKQALIHEAVTGRIDVRTGQPYPAYKDSGVQWLGAVPAHWDVHQLGRVGRLFKGGGGTKEDEIESGVPCVRYGDLYTHHRYFIAASRACVSPDVATTTYTPLRFGDVLFAGSGETIDEIGKSAINLIRGSACCGGDLIVFRPSIRVDPRFLGYACDCPASALQKACMGRGFTVIHIYPSDLKHMVVACPPLTQQTAIVRFLDRATSCIDLAIDRFRHQVKRLREYRARLVADVVTGKLDVRDAAAGLPDQDLLATDEDRDDGHKRYAASEATEDAEEAGSPMGIAELPGAAAEASTTDEM